jgi:uncharacterized protein (DUF342 family)
MAASMLLRAPQEGDAPLTVDEVLKAIEQESVVFGIDRAAVEKAVANDEFNTPIQVAVGRKPEAGSHAKFECHFDTAQVHTPKQDENGHFDYRDISFIQNAEEGQVLVTKVPPTQGKPGMSVRGREIKAIDGRDLPFKQGKNTKVSEDGLELLATANGAIQFRNGQVSVLDVIVIQGNVDHNVGNIDCRGSVRVAGHVKAGFNLKIDGDLEVNGNMEDCDVDVGGNIYVKGGFFGNGKGVMKAGGDITVKFAEGQNMVAGNEIQVGGEIMNCQVVAGERIWVKGHRGKIVGGNVSAGKEIRTAILGSGAGTVTCATVACDQQLMAAYYRIGKEQQRLRDDNQRIKEALYVLYRLQMDDKLPPEKQTTLTQLEALQKEIPLSLEDLENQKAEIEQAMSEVKDARIIVEDTLYPGVKACFGLVNRQIVNHQRRCKLTLEGNKILTSDFKGD